MQLESWSGSLGVVAVRRSESSVWWITGSGGLIHAAGNQVALDDSSLRATIRIAGVTPLGPAVRAWRARCADVLRRTGFAAAWIVGPGSVLVSRDGTQMPVSTRKEFREAAAKLRERLGQVVTVCRAVRLFGVPGEESLPANGVAVEPPVFSPSPPV